jgi:hypothetical protein
LDFSWKDLCESFGEGFLITGAVSPLSYLFATKKKKKKSRQVETGCQFSFFAMKIDLSRSTDQPKQTLSGGGLNFAVGLWC